MGKGKHWMRRGLCDHIPALRPFPRNTQLEKRLKKRFTRGIIFCLLAEDKGPECGKSNLEKDLKWAVEEVISGCMETAQKEMPATQENIQPCCQSPS